MNVTDLYNWDFNKTLFPLQTGRLAVKYGASELRQYVRSSNCKFHSQLKVSALKPGGTARRTVKLDPIMEFAFYDFIAKNRRAFGHEYTPHRSSFGYYFLEDGRPASIARSFNRFQELAEQYGSYYPCALKLDIKACFDSIRLADFMAWLRSIDASKHDCSILKKCFLAIGEGKETGFLPQGIFPAKVLGSHYLSFIEHSELLRADQSLRFVDDIYLFYNSRESMNQGLHFIQHELGERGLQINISKTMINSNHSSLRFGKGDELLHELQKKRMRSFEISDNEALFEGTLGRITEKEVGYLAEKARRLDIHKNDVNVLLAFLRSDADSNLNLFAHVLNNFPPHTKSLFFFSKYISDRRSIFSIINDFLSDNLDISEYEMFWVTKMVLEDKDRHEGLKLLSKIYRHPSSSDIIRCLILEQPTTEPELTELQRCLLKSGSENLMTWCAASGLRLLNQYDRDIYQKFMGSSELNGLLGSIFMKAKDDALSQDIPF
jgi:hypothetical protein